WTAWTCGLHPAGVGDVARLMPLAQTALEKAPKCYESLETMGMVLYRAGRFDEAVDYLNQAGAACEKSRQPRWAAIHNWLFLALAHQRLGHAVEARQWLDRAVQAPDQPATVQQPDLWDGRLEVQLLRKEAEAQVHP